MGRYKRGDSVKIEVKDETKGESEWMWLLVENSDDKQRLVFGKLDNEPIVNTDMRLGMEMAVHSFRGSVDIYASPSFRTALPAPLRFASIISEYLRERITPSTLALNAAVTTSSVPFGVHLL